MKPFLAVIAVAGTLMAPGGAFAFDLASPNTDYEARERSERLHVQREWLPGNAMAFAVRPSVKASRAEQPKAPAVVVPAHDPKGNIW